MTGRHSTIMNPILDAHYLSHYELRISLNMNNNLINLVSLIYKYSLSNHSLYLINGYGSLNMLSWLALVEVECEKQLTLTREGATIG
jgi:hypothetical protein